MIQNLVFPVVVMAAFVTAMGCFGAWCGLGWGFSFALAAGGMLAAILVLAVIGGVVQMVLARRSDRGMLDS